MLVCNGTFLCTKDIYVNGHQQLAITAHCASAAKLPVICSIILYMATQKLNGTYSTTKKAGIGLQPYTFISKMDNWNLDIFLLKSI